MDKQNILKISLTVLLATATIVGSSYAYKSLNDNEATSLAGPEDVVRSFYQQWLDYDGNPMVAKIYVDHKLLDDQFEEKIEETIMDMNMGAFDPILLAQDKPAKIEVALSRESDDLALVDVIEDFGGSKKTLKVDLKKQGDHWLITDIREENATGPLADKGTQNKIGEYIEENISELSSQEAVLGGTFYVTDISFMDGNKGLVEYEDGHIALKAEFIYELLPDGTFGINTFQVIE